MKRKQMIEFWYPGSFVSESSSAEIGHRDEKQVMYPHGVYAFQFYDFVTLDGTLENGKTITESHRENESKTYFPGGVTYTASQIEELNQPERFQTLLANMHANGYAKVVKTRRGNWQPFDEEKHAII